MARIVFMGTPEFAVPTLERLIADHHDLVAVVTQPDKPAGRGQKIEMSPVKRIAQVHGLPVLQPESVNSSEFLAELAARQPEVGIVAAFGQILGRKLLSIPPHGYLNVHASLLPRYRGASPIAAAILAGDTQTGVSIMLIDEGLDTGPVLAREVCPILPEDTAATLEARLATMGADLLARTLPDWLAGRLTPEPQDERQAILTERIEKQAGRIDWTRPAEILWRMARAYDPWPGLFGFAGERQVRFWKVRPLPDWRGPQSPGEIIADLPGLVVATGQGALELLEVQPAGKSRMSGADFRRGYRHLVRFS